MSVLYRLEVINIAEVYIFRHRQTVGEDERTAVAVDDHDALHPRQGLDDPLEAFVQNTFVSADIVVRHATCDFINLGKDTLDRLQNLERMLVQDVERAIDTLVGELARSCDSSAMRRR